MARAAKSSGRSGSKAPKGGALFGVPTGPAKSKPLSSVDKKATPIGKRGKRSK